MPKPPIVSLRVNISPVLYEKISAYRHEAKHETRAQAMVTLLAAGLAALAKPPALPLPGATAAPRQPPARSKLVAFAGSEARRTRADA